MKIDFGLIPPMSHKGYTPKKAKSLKNWNLAKSGRLIRKAADIMNDKGYVKGDLGDPIYGFCVRGAVNYAWSGNQNITTNYVYDHCGGSARNPEVVKTLTDFRDYLRSNGLIAVGSIGVEAFNDNHDGSEVIRWMHKFADETDPKK